MWEYLRVVISVLIRRVLYSDTLSVFHHDPPLTHWPLGVVAILIDRLKINWSLVMHTWNNEWGQFRFRKRLGDEQTTSHYLNHWLIFNWTRRIGEIVKCHYAWFDTHNKEKIIALHHCHPVPWSCLTGFSTVQNASNVENTLLVIHHWVSCFPGASSWCIIVTCTVLDCNHP